MFGNGVSGALVWTIDSRTGICLGPLASHVSVEQYQPIKCVQVRGVRLEDQLNPEGLGDGLQFSQAVSRRGPKMTLWDPNKR